MKKVAVFGNAGGGKSTLSRQLADFTKLPWFPIDSIKYGPGGIEVEFDTYKSTHDRILREEAWIIDGFGSMDTLWSRLDAADTLVYLDLPVLHHYWWVTKRFLRTPWIQPLGWPERSPVLKGTLNAFKTVRLCHSKLTPRYRIYVKQVKTKKAVYHLKSREEINQFRLNNCPGP